ncbi:SH3 domain-containing protein 2-like [Rutidosis leptorrhynchoides]|uniref:SH3 domain-containing protein 2-like n=1 Tax=Rutidosis leptorrhynchoides TaxID=125765 RepID=UPI003A992E68
MGFRLKGIHFLHKCMQHMAKGEHKISEYSHQNFSARSNLKQMNINKNIWSERLRKRTGLLIHTVVNQFANGAYGGSDDVSNIETDVLLHEKLERLYKSTRVVKHFQRDIVRGVEGYIVSGSKQVEIGIKLSDDSRKYGVENSCTLSKAALKFSYALAELEKELGVLLKSFGTQVAEPLRTMVMGAPLDDARHLAQSYDRMRQQAESQAVEVSKIQERMRDESGNTDQLMKLETAESKLQNLNSDMLTLGKQATSAMAAVEAQQQKMTLDRLLTMIKSERDYHQKVFQILDLLKEKMVSERVDATPCYKDIKNMPKSPIQNGSDDGAEYFIGEVMYSHYGESKVELSLSIGDYVVIRKVSSNGWAEGECKGKAGWFLAGYIERRQHVLASKVF